MMKKHYRKLIRDRIPQIMDDACVRYDVRRIDEAEYGTALRAKLIEEATEAAEAPRNELVKEIADVMEVVHALAELEGIDLRDVENTRMARLRLRGGFAERLLLAWAEDPEAGEN